MTLVYRGNGAWGTGTGVDLSEAQIDGNFWELQSDINDINTTITGGGIVSISSIAQTDTTHFAITLTNSTVWPLTLPTATFNWRGAWTPSTVYAVNDVVTDAGSVYLVLAAHTSGSTFPGPGSTYALMLAGSAYTLPSGGTTGQVLAKNSGADFDTVWNSSGMPTGGTTGQVLVKSSSTDYAASWSTIGTVPIGGTTGQILKKNSSTNYDTGWESLVAADITDYTITSPADGDVLSYSSVGADWINRRPGWIELGSISPSAVASIDYDFPSGISAYQDVLVVFENLVPSASGVGLKMQYKTGGSAITSGYVNTGGGLTSGIDLLQATNMSNTSGQGFSGDVEIWGINNTSALQYAKGSGLYMTSVPGLAAGACAGVLSSPSAAISGLSFLANGSANITGTIRIYAR